MHVDGTFLLRYIFFSTHTSYTDENTLMKNIGGGRYAKN